MHYSRQSLTRVVALGTLALAACQDATQSPTAPVVPQAPQAARSPQAQARLEAIFQNASPEVMALPGTVFADNDEVAGKVVFGVENANAMNGVRQAMARLGVDESDYAIEVTEPIVMMQTLRDPFRPTQGGIQIHFTQYLCTLGFNVDAGSVRSFITNSHCTANQGGVEGTQYHQPTSGYGTVIATEVADPVYVKNGPGCPRGKRCRRSDASRAAYSADVASNRGEIAMTTGSNNGSLTVAGTFDVTSQDNETTNFPTTTFVNKVGRTTGWTRGRVTRSCANTSVSGSTVYLMCQTFVSDPGGAVVVGSGDSGSPVFSDPNSGNVKLLGILWGGSFDNKSFVFSPLAAIQAELGSFNAVR